MIKPLSTLAALLLAVSCSWGQMTITPLPTGGQSAILQSWAQAVLGPGVQVQQVAYTGNPAAIARLNDPLNATNMDGGLLLGTGRVTNAIGGINQTSSHIFSNTPVTDPWLEPLNLLQSDIYDRAALTISFTAVSNSLPLSFRFGSEDYLEYVCSSNLDLGGIFLSGPGLSGDFPNEAVNLMTVPGSPTTPVCVNTVNNGIAGTEPETLEAYCSTFALNWANYTQYYAGPITGLVYDGFTSVLSTPAVSLIPGQPYQLVIAIADTGDPGFNSVILFGSPQSGPVTYYDTLSVATGFCAGESVSLYGQTFSMAGYYELNQVVGDTQRLVQISVEQYPAYLYTETYDACPGDVFVIDGVSLEAPAEYTLALTTAQGCDSLIHYVLRTREVDFVVENPIPLLCPGDTLTYAFGADFYLTGLPVPFRNNEGYAIPDQPDLLLEAPVEVSGYPADSTLSDAGELAICLRMEHSFMHDLELVVTCPSGVSVTLHNYNPVLPPGLGFTQLGQPSDPDDPDAPNAIVTPWGVVEPGIGWNYCWTTDATRGTFWEYATDSLASVLPPGNYNSFDPLSDLEGCPLNGTWTFALSDRWPSDNGYLFEASLDFNRSLPPYNRGWMPADSNIVALTPDSLTVAFASAGDYPYTYFVQDTEGCVYNETFTFRVRPAIEVEVDTAICGGGFLDQNFEEAGEYLLERRYPSLNFCDSLVRYRVSVSFPDTTFLTGSSCSAAGVGVFVETFPTGGACDSTVVTTVLYEPLQGVDTLTTCDPDAAGDFLLALTTAAGCDSFVVVTYLYEPLAFEVVTTPADCVTGLGSIAIVPVNANEQYLFRIGNQSSATGVFNMPPGSYTITYETLSGCDGQLSATVDAGNLPQAQFSATPLDCQGLQLTAQPAPGLSYNWTLDGLSVSTEADFEIPLLSAGIHEVCLYVANACSSDSQCQTVSIDPALEENYSLQLGAGAAQPDSCVWIPLTGSGLADVASLSGAIILTDTLPGRLTDVLPGNLAGGAFDYLLLDDWTVFFDWAAPLPGLQLADGDTVLQVRVCANGNALAGVYDLELEAIAGEYCQDQVISNTPTVFGGQFEVLPSLAISGKIIHHPQHSLSGLGIINATVNITGNTAATTNADGFYLRRVAEGGDYTVRPFKNQPLAGLSTLNIIRLLRHLNGQLPLNSPYLLLAADVDCNRTVNFDDLTVLRQTLVGSDGNLQGCPTWKFVPRNFSFGLNPFVYPDSLRFEDVDAPVEGADFYGIRTGDMLGTGTANRPGTLMALSAPAHTLAAGAVLRLPISLPQGQNLVGFQLQFEADPQALSLLSWQPADPLWSSAFNPETGRLLAYASAPIEDQLLGWLTVRAEQGGRSLEDVLRLSTAAEALPAEAYGDDLSARPLTLNWTDAPRPIAGAAMEVWPNPFREQTLLSLNLPAEDWITLELRDVAGRLLLQQRYLAPAGPSHRYLTATADMPAGVLLLTLRHAGGTFTERIVLIR